MRAALVYAPGRVPTAAAGRPELRAGLVGRGQRVEQVALAAAAGRRTL